MVDPLTVSVTVLDGTRNVTVVGDLDPYTAPIFESETLIALDGAHSLRLDLSAVTFCDSAGIAALVRIVAIAREHAVALVVMRNSILDQLFEISGIGPLL